MTVWLRLRWPSWRRQVQECPKLASSKYWQEHVSPFGTLSVLMAAYMRSKARKCARATLKWIEKCSFEIFSYWKTVPESWIVVSNWFDSVSTYNHNRLTTYQSKVLITVYLKRRGQRSKSKILSWPVSSGGAFLSRLSFSIPKTRLSLPLNFLVSFLTFPLRGAISFPWIRNWQYFFLFNETLKTHCATWMKADQPLSVINVILIIRMSNVNSVLDHNKSVSWCMPGSAYLVRGPSALKLGHERAITSHNNVYDYLYMP